MDSGLVYVKDGFIELRMTFVPSKYINKQGHNVSEKIKIYTLLPPASSTGVPESASAYYANVIDSILHTYEVFRSQN